MRNENRLRPLKITAITSVLTLFALAYIHTTSTAQNPPQRLFEIVGMNVPFQERVGLDDGVVLAIHFSGDTRGNLDTCG
jgi:hypothetical protein